MPDLPTPTISAADGAADAAAAVHRLRPEDRVGRWLGSPLGSLVARPWFDRAALWSLRRWYFPLSRLWAAARAAHGSPAAFYDQLGLPPVAGSERRLTEALRGFEGARASVNALEAEWRRVFFGGDPVSPDYLVAVETARLDRRMAYNAQRRHFRFLLRKAPIPLVRRNIPRPADVEAVYGPVLDDVDQAFAPPDPMPEVTRSRRVPAATGTNYWLRFASPSRQTADTVYARVYEPDGVTDPPTLIFGHGVCVEFDHWHGLIDEVDAMCAMGIRVIRPEAPWHGRRVPDGLYSGERFIGAAPMAQLDTFTAALREWSVLVDWARQTSAGPVAMGGSSLGALMSQLAGDRARAWPARLRPDALLLITHCWKHEDAVVHGQLAKVWGMGSAIRAAGWTDDLIHRYLPMIDPGDTPVVPPERIVSVLGSRDNVTPYASGLAMIDAWGVPDENRFIWRRGHFSVPLTMIRDHSPLRRFHAILKEIA